MTSTHREIFFKKSHFCILQTIQEVMDGKKWVTKAIDDFVYPLPSAYMKKARRVTGAWQYSTTQCKLGGGGSRCRVGVRPVTSGLLVANPGSGQLAHFASLPSGKILHLLCTLVVVRRPGGADWVLHLWLQCSLTPSVCDWMMALNDEATVQRNLT